MSARRVLLTGATGFVGACLAHRLLDDGHEVHALVRPRSARWRLAHVRADVRLHEAVLEDERRVAALVRGVRPDWVFHLAAHGAYSWETDLHAMVQTNLIGTMHLGHACLRTGVGAFVHAGSSSEYGVKDHAPSETEWLDPNSHYAITKAAATHFCRYTALREGLPLTTLRLYSVYGPWEEPNRLVPTLIVHGLAGRLPALADPRVARDFVHSDDVCEAFVRAAARGRVPGRVYNVGTGVQTTLREVVRIGRRVLGVTARPVWGSMENRAWDTAVWVADARRIRRELGWRPRADFESGLRATRDWLTSRPEVLRRYRREVRAPSPRGAAARAARR